jgi:hypothetical protein
MEFIFRPIHQWPGALRTDRRRAPFKVSYNKVLSDLDAELRQLRATNIVLQVALTDDEIRLDGRPRAGAQVRHPGVILGFDSRHGPMSYPCDTYTRWADNLRAISLALTALRAVDRYGVTRRAEQYRGWTALPAPAARMTRAEALAFVRRHYDGASEHLSDAYRAAAFRLHPDRGGDPALFHRLQEAKEVLGL